MPVRKAVPLSETRLVRRKLLRWYDRHRRDLPWRRAADPYRIWISEVMLQQTRVQAVIPYFRKFLQHFPNVKKLAAAPEQELLASWSGLGYYSRARNLQKAAQMIVEEHSGEFPRDLAAALRLPGIGRYTAAAVLSIAYGAPLAVLDGNVARVLARLCAVHADLKSTAGYRKLSSLAAGLLAPRRPGDFNQAMMELGATVCLPQQPRCDACPLAIDCVALRRNEVRRYPPLRPKKKPALRRYVAALIRDRAGRMLIVERPGSDGWMKGFWELPMWEPARESAPEWLESGRRLGSVRHSITTNRLEVAVFEASLCAGRPPRSYRWIDASEMDGQPLTTVTRKAFRMANLAEAFAARP
jgi:A/G-specific adenine glycosylase